MILKLHGSSVTSTKHSVILYIIFSLFNSPIHCYVPVSLSFATTDRPLYPLHCCWLSMWELTAGDKSRLREIRAFLAGNHRRRNREWGRAWLVFSKIIFFFRYRTPTTPLPDTQTKTLDNLKIHRAPTVSTVSAYG